MKNICSYFLLLIAMQTFTFCIPDLCENVNCKNGGTCSSGVCDCPGGFTGKYCETPMNQTWQLTFSDGGSASHIQVVKVLVTAFTYSGTFSETSDSGGLWMYDVNGDKCFKLKVEGNIVSDSPGDRWSFVGMSGTGCGMKTTGSNSSGTANGNFPAATYIANGFLTLTTESPLGTFSGQVSWTAVKQ